MMRLGIVVPCFNERPVLRNTNSQLVTLLCHLIEAGKIAPSSRVFYVDDGSKDGTWDLIEKLCAESPFAGGIKLSRNRGHQNALLAGLYTAPGDALVSIDADLQDEVQAIEFMVDEWRAGADIVFGVRDDRETDTAFKRHTAHVFYRVMSLLGVDIVYNHADFRLMTRRAIDAFKNYHEVNLFLRGIVPLIGFQTATVNYARRPRAAGESKYPLRRMLSLAWEGVTSFSVTPLRFVTVLGAVLFTLTLLMSAYVVGVRVLTDEALPGWASTVLPIYLLGGIQLFCLGILGEYLGKVYQETKARPRYFIDKSINVGLPQECN